MGEFTYRSFEPGDEEGLAEVFNYSFQSLGGGFLRTPKSILWRYINRPKGKPEEIQIAVDSESNKIVGCVYSTIESIYFGGTRYLTGAVNDVSVLPSYSRKGIAKSLMNQALEFMNTENCDFSTLCADAGGFPRSKLYIPMGYKDFKQELIWFNIFHPIMFLRLLPAVFPVVPGLAMTQLVQSFRINRMVKCAKVEGITLRIFHPNMRAGYTKTLSQKLNTFFNRVAPINFDGHVNFPKETWEYFREMPHLKGLRPTYIVAHLYGEIVGFMSLFRQFIYASKLGLHFPMGFMRECAVDHQAIGDPKLVAWVYDLLVGYLGKATHQRSCVGVTINNTLDHHHLNRALKNQGFFHFDSSIFMLKPLLAKQNQLPNTKKPINVDPGLFVGYP